MSGIWHFLGIVQQVTYIPLTLILFWTIFDLTRANKRIARERDELRAKLDEIGKEHA